MTPYIQMPWLNRIFGKRAGLQLSMHETRAIMVPSAPGRPVYKIPGQDAIDGAP